MYLENDKHKYRNIEIIALFVTPGMQRRATSRHFCLRVYIYLLFLRVDLAAFYPFPLHNHKYVHKYFKNYSKNGIHLAF